MKKDSSNPRRARCNNLSINIWTSFEKKLLKLFSIYFKKKPLLIQKRIQIDNLPFIEYFVWPIYQHGLGPCRLYTYPFAPSLPLRFASASGRVLPAPLRRAWHCGNSFLFCSPAILAAACGEWAPPSRGFGNAGSPGSCRLDLRFLNFFFSMF